jgi:hypothetical protein
MEKICRNCSVLKISSDYRSGRYMCKSCENEINYQRKKERRKINPQYDKELKAYDVKRKRKKEKEDTMSGFIQKMRQMIRKALKRGGYTKKSRTYEILGAEYEFVRNYIQNLFVDGMTWDNYGEWEYDHIIPISSGKTEEEVIKLCHYSNLQPLWKLDNRLKGNKFSNI